MPAVQYFSNQSTPIPRQCSPILSNSTEPKSTVAFSQRIKAFLGQLNNVQECPAMEVESDSDCASDMIIDNYLAASRSEASLCSTKSILKSSSTSSLASSRSKEFRFDESVLVAETFSKVDYERKNDYQLILTPAIAREIKLELNEFKSHEMLVHSESIGNTHLYPC